MVNAGHDPRKEKARRGLSLFERVTGTGRAREMAKPAAEPAQPAQPAVTPREPAFRNPPDAAPAYAPIMAQPTPPAPQPAPAPAARPAPQVSAPAAPAQQQAPAQRPAAEPAQPRLGIEPADKPRGSAMDDDLLDIPAFLRRQAN